VCGFGAGRANGLRSALKKSSNGPAFPISGAPKRVKIDRHMTIVWSGGFMTLTDTGASCEECQPSFKVSQLLDAAKSRAYGTKAAKTAKCAAQCSRRGVRMEPA